MERVGGIGGFYVKEGFMGYLGIYISGLRPLNSSFSGHIGMFAVYKSSYSKSTVTSAGSGGMIQTTCLHATPKHPLPHVQGTRTRLGIFSLLLYHHIPISHSHAKKIHVLKQISLLFFMCFK